MPEGVHEADARAACLPEAREMRGHEHLRPRLEVGPSATARGSQSWTVRIPWYAMASANGFGLRDSFDSIEWVRARLRSRQ